MALKTGVSIEGFVCLGTGPNRWPERGGVEATKEAFTMPASLAEKFMAQYGATPVTLRMVSNDVVTEVKKLYPVWMQPGDTPFHRKVILADRRIWWDRRRVRKGYNIHRNVGTKRTDPTGTDEIDPTIANVQFAAWSLKNGSPWNAVDILKDVLGEIQIIEDEWIREKMPYFIKDEAISSAQPVDQLSLNDKASDALRRVLAYLPGAEVRISLDGECVIFNRNSGAERTQIDNVGPAVHGRGTTSFVDMSFYAPAKVRVYFTREVEVRHDLTESGSVSDTIASIGEGRTLTNVIAIPDITIRVTPRGGGAAYEAAQFTYVDFHQYLIAINNDLASAPFGDLDKIDYDILQQAFVPGMGLWNAFRVNGELNPSANWTARIGALEDAYRVLFMINPKWTDRSLSIKASSILTIDNALGERGPARVYADFAVVPSMRGVVKSWQETEKIPFVINHKSYPVGGIITSTTRASRCKVIMEHEDQGVFRLEWRPNARGLDDMVLPSMVEVVVGGESQGVDAEGKPKMGGPDSHLGNTPDVISFDSSADENTYCKLTSDYRAIVILLHVPAAPNSKEQLHEILVDPPDVANLLPAAIASGIRGARGPIMDVEIGSSIETARIPWQDTVEHASIVEALFGARGTPPPSSSIANRVINLGTSNTKTGASITAIAFAAAARVYAKFADRYMGQKAGHLNPNILAEGRISEVVHEITPRGEGFSTLILPEEMLDVDMMAFLPESARRIILRLPGIDTKRGS